MEEFEHFANQTVRQPFLNTNDKAGGSSKNLVEDFVTSLTLLQRYYFSSTINLSRTSKLIAIHNVRESIYINDDSNLLINDTS